MKCHVCGVGRPERPASPHPTCHACRCAIGRRREKHDADPVAGAAGEQAARAWLHDAIVNLRQWRIARGGWSDVSPYLPLPEHRGAAKVTTP